MFRSAILTVALLLSTVAAQKETLTAQQQLLLFDNWKVQHHKQYDSEQLHEKKYQIWLENDARIKEYNAQIPKPTATLGHNEYSDLSQEEFAAHFKLGQQQPADVVKTLQNSLSTERRQLGTVKKLVDDEFNWLHEEQQQQPLELPDFVNWVALGGVTPIKNQGSCGSCWAFSTTGALEGAKFVQTGELVSLSEQNLLDCDHTDLGCNGGLMDNAFKFDEKSGGLCSEADYPYVAKRNKVCKTNCTDVPGSIVKTFIDVPPGNPNALISAIAMQPISVAIEASQFVFQFYKTGVITDDSCGKNGNVDHGVLAVGYGSDLETGEPYFLVKNSWGETWGSNGFVKIGRTSKNKYGICSILKMASFPVTE